MKIEAHHVDTAFRKLKRFVYYDKNDLHLRHRLAEFECSSNFKKQLLSVKKVLNNKEPSNEPDFKKWLEEIDFRIIPKSFYAEESGKPVQSESQERFISNVTSSKYQYVEKVNYFFDGPIELHLIAVLWIMFEGRLLDAKLGKECYGSRLSGQLNDEDDQSGALFQKYHELYAQWRDAGIKKAKQLLIEENSSVCILGLDVQEYYYRIKLNFPDIAKTINNEMNVGKNTAPSESQPSNLLVCLESIYVSYRKRIEESVQLTHDDMMQNSTGIPIGICSSPVLANWYLMSFDKDVKSKLKPAYYGRYVDDILLVIEASVAPSLGGQPVTDYINDMLVRNNLLHPAKDDRYEIRKPCGLYLQKTKCILQYFDVEHSIAGLDKFQKKLDENSSDFLLLPVDEADSSLEDVAYELMYDGSVNKFRSVKGLAENRYELAKYLARQTILHLLTDDRQNSDVSIGLRKFFKGRNAILFHDLWERVFTYFVIANDKKSADILQKSLLDEISRIRVKGRTKVTKAIRDNLMSHLSFSRAMGDALVVKNEPLLEKNENAPSFSFRRSNLVRHHFIRLPLINYTDYIGSLTARKIEKRVKVIPEMIRLSPRFVNFDECLLLADSGWVSKDQAGSFEWASTIYQSANGKSLSGVNWTTEYTGQEDGGDV